MRAESRPRTVFNRRDFLTWAWLASLSGLAGQSGLALLRFLQPRIQAEGFGGEVVAGAVEEFRPGTVSHIARGRFFISALEDGGVVAVWQRCTHLGCTVPWREAEGLFHCPCHSSLFNRQGEVLGGPAPRPLDLFPLRVEDGNLIADTGRPIQRERFDLSQAFYPG